MRVHEPLPHQERSAERSGSILCSVRVNRCTFINKTLCTAFRSNFSLLACVIIVLHSKPCSTVTLRHWHQFYHCSHVGGAVWVLGGQHICTALQKLQAKYLQGGKVLPVWLSHVQCDMIKEDWKLSIRQQITGDNNAVQQSCSSLRPSDLETDMGCA